MVGEKDLNDIIERVNVDLPDCSSDTISMNESVHESLNENDANAEVDLVYVEYLRRCSEIFNILKNEPVPCQDRRSLRKRNLSFKQQKYANKVCNELIRGLSDEDKHDLDKLNTVIYSIAVVFTYKEGQEFLLPDGNSSGGKRNDGEPAWKLRMERNIARWRKEVDLLSEFISGRLKKKNSINNAQKVMKRYAINSDKNSINKTIFILKNKITAIAAKLKRYITQEKSRRQNEQFSNNRKQFYRDIEPSEKNTIPTPPSEDELRKFWGEEIFGKVDLYDLNA